MARWRALLDYLALGGRGFFFLGYGALRYGPEKIWRVIAVGRRWLGWTIGLATRIFAILGTTPIKPAR